MNKDIKIVKFVDPKSRFFNQLCKWMYGWWGKKDGWTQEKVKNFMKAMLSKERVPQTYIATDGDNVFGMYQFGMDDLDVRPDIYPWLENVYIDEKYRGNGICRLMMESVANSAKSIGLKEIYLYTKHVGLYEKFGWKFIGEIETFKTEAPIQRLYKLSLS